MDEIMLYGAPAALLAFAALVVMIRQQRKIRSLQTDVAVLAHAQEERKARAEALRGERAQWLEPLAALEPHLRKRDALTEEELRQVAVSREGLRKIADALRHDGMWLGPPFDLEWPDYIERTPKVKALYMKKLTSGS